MQDYWLVSIDGYPAPRTVWSEGIPASGHLAVEMVVNNAFHHWLAPEEIATSSLGL